MQKKYSYISFIALFFGLISFSLTFAYFVIDIKITLSVSYYFFSSILGILFSTIGFLKPTEKKGLVICSLFLSLYFILTLIYYAFIFWGFSPDPPNKD